ncbi:hypothetical protein EJB05_51266, partial [Eragrostis curvula]
MRPRAGWHSSLSPAGCGARTKRGGGQEGSASWLRAAEDPGERGGNLYPLHFRASAQSLSSLLASHWHFPHSYLPSPPPLRTLASSMAWAAAAVLVVAAAVLSTASVASASNLEGDALYALRQALADPRGVLQSWDPTLVNPCTWFHVTCNRDGRVTRLDLGNSNLSGQLVPELGHLEHLQYLELYKNNIQGTIPAELGNLKSLISLDLYNNTSQASYQKNLAS